MCKIIGNLSKDVFERRTSTGSEVFSLLICLDANKFVLLSFSSLIKTIYPRFSTEPLPNDAKSPLPVDVRRSKTLLLKLPNKWQRYNRCIARNFQRYAKKVKKVKGCENGKLVITNTVIAAAQATLKRASEQGSRPNPHRDKNFQLPTIHLEFWITLQGIFLAMTIPCTPIAFIYQNPLAISVTWSLLRFGWNPRFNVSLWWISL